MPDPYGAPQPAQPRSFWQRAGDFFSGAWDAASQLPPSPLNPESDAVVAGGIVKGIINEVKTVEKTAEATEDVAKGGTYLLRDAEGEVMRTGRTKDLARREAEHARDPVLKNYQFEVVHRTDVYAQQRGLEQMLHNTYNPPLNYVQPISPGNANFGTYMDAAESYLRGGGK